MPFALDSGYDSSLIERPCTSFKTFFNLQRIGHLVILKVKMEEKAVIDFFFLTNTATWHKSLKYPGSNLRNPLAILVESQVKICAHSCISRSQLQSISCLLPPDVALWYKSTFTKHQLNIMGICISEQYI